MSSMPSCSMCSHCKRLNREDVSMDMVDDFRMRMRVMDVPRADTSAEMLIRIVIRDLAWCDRECYETWVNPKWDITQPDGRTEGCDQFEWADFIPAEDRCVLED